MSIVNQTIGAPIGTGTVPLTSSSTDVGLVVLRQTVTLNKDTAGDSTFSGTIKLPPNSQIVDIIEDELTAWDSATSAGLTIGISAGGTEYASSKDLKAAAGRVRPTFTAAQLLAMSNISTNTTVYCTVAQVGATTAGKCIVTIEYVQIASAGTQ